MARCPSGLAPGPLIGSRKTRTAALTEPLGLNRSTTLRTSGGRAAMNAASIGTTVGPDVQPDHRVGPRVVDGPDQARRLLADQAPQVDLELPVVQDELAAHVFERIGEVAIDRRHVAAGDRRLDVQRAVGLPAEQVERGVDAAPRLEDLPELDELLGGPGAEPLVELQVDHVELQVERRSRRHGRPPASPRPGRSRGRSSPRRGGSSAAPRGRRRWPTGR